MRWPMRSVESVPPSRFHPPFCPWAACPDHTGDQPHFHRHGSYRRPSDGRRIPRYRCLACRRTCSRQTFSFTYYLKRRDLPAEVAAGLMAGSAHRQIARSRSCAKTSVTRQAERLSRHAVLFHARALSHLAAIREPVVHDHFETFVGRQDRALGVGLPVGARSWFVFDADPAPHRGSGRRPDRAPAPNGPPPGTRAYVASIRRTLSLLAPRVPADSRLRLRVDGRKDYQVALERHAHRDRFALEVFPNPKRGPKGSPRSPEARVRDRAMLPVDALHQLLRHTCKDHARETIAFGRRLESILGRIFLMIVWRNFGKRRTERRPDPRTPAMTLGLTDHPWRWPRVLAKRLFPAHEALPDLWTRLHRSLDPAVQHI